MRISNSKQITHGLYSTYVCVGVRIHALAWKILLCTNAYLPRYLPKCINNYTFDGFQLVDVKCTLTHITARISVYMYVL